MELMKGVVVRLNDRVDGRDTPPLCAAESHVGGWWVSVAVEVRLPK